MARRATRKTVSRTASWPSWKRFYYDLAGAANPGRHCFAPQAGDDVAGVVRHSISRRVAAACSARRRLTEIGMFSESDLRAVDRDNALRLFPRLKG